MQGLRTSLKEIPVSNKKLLKETAAITNTELSFVTDIIDFVGKYTKQRIEEGKMEGVMIPYFGKFVPRVKMLKARLRDKDKATFKPVKS